MWKIRNVESGETLRAGFKLEDAARDWLDEQPNLEPGDFEVLEMGAEEEEEWLESQEESQAEEMRIEADDDDEDDDDDADDDYLETDLGEDGDFDYGDDDEDDYEN